MSAAFRKQIRLQVIVNNLAARLRQAALVAVVAVPKVVALAARQEVEPQRLVGRVRAPVRGPDQLVGRLGRPRRLELLHRGVQEESVGGGQAARVVARAAEELGDRERKGKRGGKGGEDGEEKDEEEESLHGAFWV